MEMKSQQGVGNVLETQMHDTKIIITFRCFKSISQANYFCVIHNSTDVDNSGLLLRYLNTHNNWR